MVKLRLIDKKGKLVKHKNEPDELFIELVFKNDDNIQLSQWIEADEAEEWEQWAYYKFKPIGSFDKIKTKDLMAYIPTTAELEAKMDKALREGDVDTLTATEKKLLKKVKKGK